MYTLELTEEELFLIKLVLEYYGASYEQGTSKERYELHRHTAGLKYLNRAPEETYILIQQIRKQCENKLRAEDMTY